MQEHNECVEVVANSTDNNTEDIDVEAASHNTSDVEASSKGLKKSIIITIGVVALISLVAAASTGGHGIRAFKSTQTTNFSASGKNDCDATKAPSAVNSKSSKSPSPSNSPKSKCKKTKATKAPETESPSPSFSPSEASSNEPSTDPSISPSVSVEPSTDPSISPSTSKEPSTNPSQSPSTSIEPSTDPSISPSTSIKPSTNPSQSPSTSIEPSTEPSLSPPPCAHLAGGGWVRVRHVPAGNLWHPATDSLKGTDVYGTEGDDSAPWSVNFADKLPTGYTYDRFLFATGNCGKWLVATVDAVIGTAYSNEPRQVIESGVCINRPTDANIGENRNNQERPPIRSCEKNGYYMAKWYNRDSWHEHLEDPWVTIFDYSDAISDCMIVYLENSYTDVSSCFHPLDGADVYILPQPE